jgi:hypothetical protein
MNDTIWLALVENLPQTLTALATLVVAIRGFNRLSREVNGHTQQVMQAMHQAGKAEAKAETVTQLLTPPQQKTTVITDRRKTERTGDPG